MHLAKYDWESEIDFEIARKESTRHPSVRITYFWYADDLTLINKKGIIRLNINSNIYIPYSIMKSK